MLPVCQTWVQAQMLCLNLRSCVLHLSDQIMWKLLGSPTMKPCILLTVFIEKGSFIFLYISFFLTWFPQFSLTKLPCCHFQDFPVLYFLLAERRRLVLTYSSVLFSTSSGPDIFGYMKKKKNIMKSTLLKCLIASKWFTHWASGAA